MYFLNFVFHYLKTHNNLFFDGSNDELTFLSTSSFSLFCLSLSSLCFCKISRIRWRELEDVVSGVIETELAPLVPPWLLLFWFFSRAFLEAKSAAKRMAMASSLRSWNYNQNSDKILNRYQESTSMSSKIHHWGHSSALSLTWISMYIGIFSPSKTHSKLHSMGKVLMGTNKFLKSHG